MKGELRQRGPKPRIDPKHWAEMQAMDRQGKTLSDIMAWLETQGIKVSMPTASRAMERIRAAAPPAPLPPPLGPATDEEELKVMRAQFRDEMRMEESARDRQGAARLVLAVMAEQRMRNEPKKSQELAPAEWKPPSYAVKPIGAN